MRTTSSLETVTRKNRLLVLALISRSIEEFDRLGKVGSFNMTTFMNSGHIPPNFSLKINILSSQLFIIKNIVWTLESAWLNYLSYVIFLFFFFKAPAV